MTSTPNHESKLAEETLGDQVIIDEVELGQVAKRWTRAMVKYGVEARGQHSDLPVRIDYRPIFFSGILPVPPERRTDTQYSKIFFVWFSMNFNILSFVHSPCIVAPGGTGDTGLHSGSPQGRSDPQCLDLGYEIHAW